MQSFRRVFIKNKLVIFDFSQSSLGFKSRLVATLDLAQWIFSDTLRDFRIFFRKNVFGTMVVGILVECIEYWN